jgi:DNA mismatch repair protein MutL
MSEGKIALLPDHVANQIAAGEVVQRPASVVKELIENAIDAGATRVTLIIKDAGKTLLQVNDNGYGMNPFDARLCFERHATSKITNADDLFRLATKGFRGEALASIAAVAQVELRTKRAEDAVGQKVVIEGGKFIVQEECQSPTGTSLIIKNLFFNIPARRNFLKNDQVEQKHILEEVERIAIPHTNVHFVVNSNGNELLNLPAGNLMQRLKSLLGSYIQKELVPVEETTPYVKISGYVSLPEFTIKQRKEQFLFVNNRYIRSAFLNHAIYEGYKDLIGPQSHPRFFIFLELQPSEIDINIHPTKTEVKFTDDKTVYMLLSSAIKRALGKANASPSLNFENEMSFAAPSLSAMPKAPTIGYNPAYNPFSNPAPLENKSNKANWENLFDGFQNKQDSTENLQQELTAIKSETVDFTPIQLNQKYIVAIWQQNVLIVDQQRAHERVLYEHYLNSNLLHPVASQQKLFPDQIELSVNDFTLVKDLIPELKTLGFDLDIFGKNSIVVNGAPTDMEDFNIPEILEGILETFRLNTIDAKVEKHDNLSRAIAKNTCIRYGKSLDTTEMKALIQSLFACENPLYTANGKYVMMTVENSEIEKFFRK